MLEEEIKNFNLYAFQNPFELDRFRLVAIIKFHSMYTALSLVMAGFFGTKNLMKLGDLMVSLRMSMAFPFFSWKSCVPSCLFPATMISSTRKETKYARKLDKTPSNITKRYPVKDHSSCRSCPCPYCKCRSLQLIVHVWPTYHDCEILNDIKETKGNPSNVIYILPNGNRSLVSSS